LLPLALDLKYFIYFFANKSCFATIRFECVQYLPSVVVTAHLARSFFFSIVFMYDICLKHISFVEVVIRHLTSLTSIHHRELARKRRRFSGPGATSPASRGHVAMRKYSTAATSIKGTSRTNPPVKQHTHRLLSTPHEITQNGKRVRYSTHREPHTRSLRADFRALAHHNSWSLLVSVIFIVVFCAVAWFASPKGETQTYVFSFF
jgi:hypothetical protein